MKPPMVLNSIFALALAATTMAGCGGNNANNAVDSLNVAPVSLDADPTSLLAPGEKGQLSLKRNFYFVFDGSGSMNAQPARASSSADQRFSSKIQGAKWAVHEFLEKVPADVNLGLYVFDAQGSREVLPLGKNNRAAFLQAIDSVNADGSTPLGAAITTGSDALARQYQRQLGYGDYRLIVITDGEANDDLSRGVEEAEKYKIPICTIGFDMGQDHALRKNSISYRSADSATEVEKGLEEAAGELDIFDPATFKEKQAQTAKSN